MLVRVVGGLRGGHNYEWWLVTCGDEWWAVAVVGVCICACVCVRATVRVHCVHVCVCLCVCGWVVVGGRGVRNAKSASTNYFLTLAQ